MSCTFMLFYNVNLNLYIFLHYLKVSKLYNGKRLLYCIKYITNVFYIFNCIITKKYIIYEYILNLHTFNKPGPASILYYNVSIMSLLYYNIE
jgi:hypothetical protein